MKLSKFIANDPCFVICDNLVSFAPIEKGSIVDGQGNPPEKQQDVQDKDNSAQDDQAGWWPHQSPMGAFPMGALPMGSLPMGAIPMGAGQPAKKGPQDRVDFGDFGDFGPDYGSSPMGARPIIDPMSSSALSMKQSNGVAWKDFDFFPAWRSEHQGK
jgi:hypothetical protein